MFSDINLPNDLSVIIFFVIIFFGISLIVLKRSNNALLSVTVFSVLCNLIVLFVISLKSLIFFTYNLEWFQYFSLLIWPLLNIYLIIKNFQTKK